MPKPLDLLSKLKAFELAHPAQFGPRCTACSLPEPMRDFIVEGRKAGSTFRSIAAVLTGEGHRISYKTVGRHYRDHVEGQ